MTEPLLEIRGLTVRYAWRLATWGVDLALDPGEVLGLVGESGAGKSTVGRAVVRLLPEPGRVEAGRIRSPHSIRRSAWGSRPATRSGSTVACRARPPTPRWTGSSDEWASPIPRTSSRGIRTSCPAGCGSGS